MQYAILKMPNEFKFTVSPRRKYPALRIDSNGVLEFLAPVGFPLSAAEKLVEKNSKVVERLRERHEILSERRQEFFDGMSVFWYGKAVPVRFTQKAKAVTEEGIFVPGGEEKKVRKGLELLYKTEAVRYLPERTHYLAEKFGINIKRVTVGSATGRWGCCKRDGCIRYSWRLIQCGTDLIDYIIIHELAHRLVFDHSVKFWQEVEKMLPDSEWYKKKLRIFSKEKRLL